MIKKIALAFCAMLLLAGCSSSMKKHERVTNCQVMEFEKEIGNKVLFAYNTSSLSQEAQQSLMRQAQWLKAHPTFNITVEGHCDERGTREYNIALGERRAHAIKSFLMHNAVESDRIETISYGKERPAVIGDNEAAWSKNRRGVTALR
ncbi:MAG: peptidoglycan-associated lipoprotein Pal [Rickettsiaceae bacterium]